MSKENYFNGGCSTCMFAERDERGRYLGSCSGFSNCSYEEYKGETDITEEEKDKKIAELEAKLAESKESHHKNIVELTKITTEKDRKIEELKQQLAEKEKEIENLTLAHFESETNKPVLTTTQIINQDKISFAVEQLEKVKEFVKENESWEIEGSDYSIVYADDVLEEINNQIKQLKEGK